MTSAPLEQFPVLTETGIVLHGFTLRIPGLDVETDRATALLRLEKYHTATLTGLGNRSLQLAQQVHGKGIAVVDRQSARKTLDVDGLITRDPAVTLGIYVADCCAIYLVDPVRSVIGLVHSGKKGTALNIAGESVHKMQESFGSDPAHMVAQLSPCIRPPNYEIDFAAEIILQLQSAGLQRIQDCCQNTGADPKRFYSYRMEKGQTGRMLAFMALKG
jgi:purine-nucleoside/S-methyl-5'-thioadenosine phosphorylase / adenosine deaminase